jgi:hypothetical protein
VQSELFAVVETSNLKPFADSTDAVSTNNDDAMAKKDKPTIKFMVNCPLVCLNASFDSTAVVSANETIYVEEYG